MTNKIYFAPPRTRGFITQGLLLVFAFGLMLTGIRLGLQSSTPWQSGLGIGLAFLAFLMALRLFYNLYALTHSGYAIAPDLLILQYGLRQEIIAAADIVWVRPPAQVADFVPPRVFLPGHRPRTRRLPDTGWVEWLATDRAPLLLVKTERRTFVISPEAPQDFMETLRKMLESSRWQAQGSQTIYPAEWLRRPWRHAAARFLWTFTLIVNLGLLAWISLLLPEHIRIPAGYDAYGLLRPAIPLANMLWFSLAGLLGGLLAWLSGLLFYPDEKQRWWAWVLWSAAALQSFLYLLGFYLLLQKAIL